MLKSRPLEDDAKVVVGFDDAEASNGTAPQFSNSPSGARENSKNPGGRWYEVTWVSTSAGPQLVGLDMYGVGGRPLGTGCTSLLGGFGQGPRQRIASIHVNRSRSCASLVGSPQKWL